MTPSAPLRVCMEFIATLTKGKLETRTCCDKEGSLQHPWAGRSLFTKCFALALSRGEGFVFPCNGFLFLIKVI